MGARTAVALLGLAAALGCNTPTPRSLQQNALKAHLPAPLAVPGFVPDAGPTRVVRVLALADDDYRVQSLNYATDIPRQFADITKYTLPALNVRFEVLDVLPWSHRAGSATVERALERLEQEHPGEGFDLVVGFVSALSVVEANFHLIGAARHFGRHAIARAVDDGALAVYLRDEFRAVDLDELEAFHLQRKRHLQTTLLLHEWGHGLGAGHDPEPRGLMHPSYLLSQNAFSPHTLDVLRASLEPAPLPKRAQKIRALLEQNPPSAHYQKDHAAFLDELRAIEASGAAPSSGPSAAEVERYNLAVTLFNNGMFVESAQQLKPLLASLPRNGRVRGLQCDLAVATAPGDAATVRTCEESATAAPRFARPLLSLADVHLFTRRPDLAGAALERAALVLAGDPEDAADAWRLMATLARRASCVTFAELAGQKSPSPEGADAAAWAKKTRRWMGLPTAGAQCEHAHVARFRDAQKQLDLGNVGSLLDGFPAGSPARASLECEVALRKGRLPAAHKACDQALAVFPESSHAHYLLGVLGGLERRPADVVQHLTEVVALDPSIDDAYVRLAAALKQLGKTDALADLKARFEARFKKPLR